MLTLEDELVVSAAAAASAFFVVLSFGLLLKFRQISQRANASTDLGKDLWGTLEQRLNKQDERIVDMMGRLEVIQEHYSNQRRPVGEDKPRPLAEPAPAKSPPVAEVVPPRPSEAHDSPLASRITPEVTTEVTQITLDETELKVLNLLAARPRSSVEVKELIGTSREHAARLMKVLFDAGLVVRNTSRKPFVYQLTDSARSRLPNSGN